MKICPKNYIKLNDYDCPNDLIYSIRKETNNRIHDSHNQGSTFSFNPHDSENKVNYLNELIESIYKNSGMGEKNLDLISIYEKEVNQLKKEKEDYHKTFTKKYNPLDSESPINDENEINYFLQTLRSKYISLNDINYQKEEIYNDIIGIDKEFENLKNYSQAGIERLHLLQDYEECNFDNTNLKDKSKIKNNRSNSAQGIKRSGGDRILTDKDQLFIKQFIDYTNKKEKHGLGIINKTSQEEFINKNEEEFKYLSLENRLEIIKNKENKGFDSTKRLHPHMAFVKMIYNLLKKDNGLVDKQDIIEKIDDRILNDLGFDSLQYFKEALTKFPSEKEGLLALYELTGFLLSHSELGEEYLLNIQNNMQSDNQLDFEYQLTDDEIVKYKEKRSNSIDNFNSNLTIDLKKTIKSNKLKVNYDDYLEFTEKFKTRNDLKFTIPDPFEFLKKYDYSKKNMKVEEILDERKRKEKEILSYRFIPNELNRNMFIGTIGNIVEREKMKRKYRTERLMEKIVQEMKPFSFTEQDELKYKLKLLQEYQVPKFLPFKANPVPWRSQILLLDEIQLKQENERKARVEERARVMYANAKLPPRMEMHEKKRKKEEENLKSQQVSNSKEKFKFKAKEVPNFSERHEKFYNFLENKKAESKPTKPIPFTFHEPKIKANLHEFLDLENDPQSKNPQIKNNIKEIINKIHKKPKIEPASTRSLDLLMATRRKELDMKQKVEEEKAYEDKLRYEKQNRLKERVINSNFIVDNAKALEEKKKKQKEDFKNNLKENQERYHNELSRRLQRVYNKPLMFESMSERIEKFSHKEKRNNSESNINESGEE